MENLQKIAMLIDADNTQLSKIEMVIREISAHGRIIVKRAYGNWKKETLKNWEEELKRLAIKAEQQFDYVSGKNATDMALVIDAMELMHTDIYDAFVIVASDSDYTPLAIKLHESGVYVMGVGERKTPEAFRNACDEFVFLENLDKDKSSKSQVDKNEAADHKSENMEGVNDDTDKEPMIDFEEIHHLIKIAYDKYEDDDGYANISSAGAFIKRAKPDFDSRTYGFIKLSQLLEAFPEKYELKKYPGKGSATIIEYKCI